jgi:hypothetical protein
MIDGRDCTTGSSGMIGAAAGGVGCAATGPDGGLATNAADDGSGAGGDGGGGTGPGSLCPSSMNA